MATVHDFSLKDRNGCASGLLQFRKNEAKRRRVLLLLAWVKEQEGVTTVVNNVEFN